MNLYLHTINTPLDNFDRSLERIPSFIQRRILRKKQQKKRDSSLIAYLMLQQALLNDFGLKLGQMEYLDSGKPVFTQEDIHFNISHSHNLVGVAISKAGRLGLDIEGFRKFENVQSAFSFFSLVEQKAILDDENPDWKLIEFWSKKEALVKAVGGQMFDMAAHTDIRFSTTTWKNEKFHFHHIPHPFDGFIWIASSFSTNTIVTKENIEL